MIELSLWKHSLSENFLVRLERYIVCHDKTERECSNLVTKISTETDLSEEVFHELTDGMK